MYFTDDGLGVFFHVRRKKNSWQAGVGGRKMKKGKIKRFSVEIPIDRSGNVNPACQRKKNSDGYFIFSLDIIPAHRSARHPQNIMQAA